MGTLIQKIEIKIGSIDSNNYNFLNMVLVQELLKPNVFSFTMQKKEILDCVTDSDFPLSKQLIGKKVRCKIVTIRFDEKDEEVGDEMLEFKGVVFQVNVRRRSDMFSEQLIDVKACSPDYLLNDHPHCISYENEKLKTIISATLNPYEIPNEIDPKTTDSIPYTVQYNESNYQFLTRLALRYGEWMYNDGSKWIFGKIKKKDKVILEPRNDIINYNFQAVLMHHNLTHAHHNYLKYKNQEKSDSDFYDLTQPGYHFLTDLTKEKSDSLFIKNTFQHLQCSNPEDNNIDELEISAKAQLYGEKTQQVVCTGETIRADLRIGSVIEINDHFYNDDGADKKIAYDKLIITSIVHTADMEGEYSNRFTAVPANSEYPPYFLSDVFPRSSAQRAKVKDNKDPEKLGRIRVQFLWQELQDENLMTPWIRMAQPHGGSDKGFYFIPEIDEEVMVDFENGNAEKPYVVGTLYYGEKQLPDKAWYSDDNDIKAIRTRNGHTIEIHDEGEDGFIKIYDNEKENYILTFSTDEKLIKLESTGNIELYADKDIIMKANGNINMQAGSDITEKADMNMSLEAGTNISLKANSKMALESAMHEQKASGTMKIDGGGMLEAKAGMVKIN